MYIKGKINELNEIYPKRNLCKISGSDILEFYPEFNKTNLQKDSRGSAKHSKIYMRDLNSFI